MSSFSSLKLVFSAATLLILAVPVHAEGPGGGALTAADIFPADRVVEVEITLAEEDWDTIRHQTRNLFEVLAEERKDGPIESPYFYVDASVTIDGHHFEKVGVRKKGFIGSQSSTRPSLKIKLNHVDEAGGIDGSTNLTLNNNNQDGTLVNQFLGYGLFNAAGSPAPRCALARVTVNGKNLGIYSHVESMRKPLMERAFGSPKGVLYEGTVVDFFEGWQNSFEHKFGKDEEGREKIKKLIAVLENEELEDVEAAIGELVDLDAFYTFWAVEGLIGFWDGYSGNQNNYFVYLNPGTGKFHFLPWGADALFDKYHELEPNPEAPLSVKTKGMIAYRLYQTKGGRERYARTLQGLLETVWDEKKLVAELERIEKLVRPYLAESQKNHAEALDEVREFVEARRGDLAAELAGGLPEWTVVPPPPPVIPASFAEGMKADSIWNAAKTGDVEAIAAQLEQGVEVDARDQMGSVPLALAALTGEVKAVKFLIAMGADVNASNNENQSVLHTAAFAGRVAVVKELLAAGADVNVRNDTGETPLDVAAVPWNTELEGFVQIIGGLMQVTFDVEEIKAGRPMVVELLREQGAKAGADLPAPVEDGPDFWEAAKAGNVEALSRHLGEEGLDLNAHDKNGITALSWAALTGQTEAAELLIAKGADVDARDRDGGVPVHGAAFLGHVGVTKVLIKHKADLNVRDQQGHTALDSVAAPWGPEMEGIVRFIAGFLKIEVDIEKLKEVRPAIAELLKQNGAQHAAELK